MGLLRVRLYAQAGDKAPVVREILSEVARAYPRPLRMTRASGLRPRPERRGEFSQRSAGSCTQKCRSRRPAVARAPSRLLLADRNWRSFARCSPKEERGGCNKRRIGLGSKNYRHANPIDSTQRSGTSSDSQPSEAELRTAASTNANPFTPSATVGNGRSISSGDL